MAEQLEDTEPEHGPAVVDNVAQQFPASIMTVESLRAVGSPRQAGISLSHAQLLAEIPADQLPPILVHRATMRVIDGMHRLHAATIRGDRTIAGRYVDCSEAQAFLLAVRENSQHGMPLSRADREAAAGRVLDDHPDWSDRAVAAAVGVGTATVATVRGRSAATVTPLASRVGRDGKLRPVDGADGRRRAAELISARPMASLREIARETNISPGTARDVRERLRQGRDPVPSRERLARTGPPRPASSARPAPARDPGNPRAAADDWPALRAKLSRDPSLRYSDSGRALVAWLERHSMSSDGSRAFIGGVPAHWAGPVAKLARAWSQEWQDLATELEQRE